MSSAKGKLIVIEGLEGAGKSTAVRTVVDFLTQLKINTLTVREPGGTAIGEELRQIFKNPAYQNILDDKSELLLLYAARVQLLEQVIKPALSEGTWVIADRFELSTMAYQGGGRGLDQEIMTQLSSFALNGFKPDLTLYMDISPEQGLMRVRARGECDRIEQQSLEFFQRVQERYLQDVRINPNTKLIDSSHPLAEVQEAIKNALHEFIEHNQ